jgi:hypothetical protein
MGTLAAAATAERTAHTNPAADARADASMPTTESLTCTRGGAADSDVLL